MSFQPYSDTYRFLHVDLEISTDSQELLHFFQRSYQRFRISCPAEHQLQFCAKLKTSPCRLILNAGKREYRVLKTTQGFALRNREITSGADRTTLFSSNGQQLTISWSDALRNADTKQLPQDREHLFSFAQMALLNSLADCLRPEYHLFHGAALTWQDSGLILAGASGRGKSSLSLALVKHGCKFLSDDIACVHLRTGQLIPFPRRVNFRQKGMPVLRNLLKDREISPGSADMEAIFPDSIGRPTPLRCLVLLKEISEQPKLTPLSGRNALWQALRLSHTPVHQPGQTLFRLAPLFNRVRCYELIAGDLDSTANLLCHHLEQELL